MCGRFSRIAGQDVIEDRFNVARSIGNFPKSYNVAPTQKVPVVIRENPNVLVGMKWGFQPYQSSDPSENYNIINTRSETILEKKLFSKSFSKTRCLVPATGFYEWKVGASGKIPYYIKLRDKELFAMAGIYTKNNYDATSTFSIITTEPNEILKPIQNRMPVILKRHLEDQWLNQDTPINELLEMLKPYDTDGIETYAVSKYVNSPNNNSEICIKPLNQREIENVEMGLDKSQQRLDDFF